jgi:hypothetical protein
LTSDVPTPGTQRCNSVGLPDADETAVRILSADNAAHAADVPCASADVLDFQIEV